MSDSLVEELGKYQMPLKYMIEKASKLLVTCLEKTTECSRSLQWLMRPYCSTFTASKIVSIWFWEKCADTLPIVKDVFAIIESMEGSPQRMVFYGENLKKFSIQEGTTTLGEFSDTLWTARTENPAVTANTLPALVATLEELKASDAACEWLLISISILEFLLKVLVLKEDWKF